MRKGQKLMCVPCGREIVVSSSGISRTTLWCCGRPMKSPGTAKKKKTVSKKKTTAKKKK